jgi:hypothetical protein
MYREEAGVGDLDRPGTALGEPKRRSAGSRFGDLGDRLARTFSTSDRADKSWESNGDVEYPVDSERASPWDDVVPRFAITRQGYDCAAVDEHVAELERELAELDQELAEMRARAPSGSEVAAEIQRIGEQTSTILLAAHDEAQQTTRRAQEQADRCLADAASNAISITEEANRQLREFEREKASLTRERARLLEDVRTVATALSSLADDAVDRFPPELGAASTHVTEAANSTGEG